MNELKDKYKLAIIPKDTLLFRKAPDKNAHDTMFFSFDFFGTNSSDYSNFTTQIWATQKPIISRLLVKGKLSPQIYETDLEYCYEKFCGEKKYYLDIKHRLNPKRKPFLDFLTANGMDTWVTSVENGTPMELHLYTANNRSLVKFKQFIDTNKNSTLTKKDSFDNVILLDSNTLSLSVDT